MKWCETALSREQTFKSLEISYLTNLLQGILMRRVQEGINTISA